MIREEFWLLSHAHELSIKNQFLILKNAPSIAKGLRLPFSLMKHTLGNLLKNDLPLNAYNTLYLKMVSACLFGKKENL